MSSMNVQCQLNSTHSSDLPYIKDAISVVTGTPAVKDLVRDESAPGIITPCSQSNLCFHEDSDEPIAAILFKSVLHKY